jgi:hypothetical protein
MKNTHEIKSILLQLLSKSSYNDSDRLLIAETFDLHLESTTIVVGSFEQKEIVETLLKKG